MGKSEPFSVTGSLPLVGDLQKAGFDVLVSGDPANCLILHQSFPSLVQMCGYGHSHVYHGDNEYCSLSAMQNAMKILSKLLDCYNK